MKVVTTLCLSAALAITAPAGHPPGAAWASSEDPDAAPEAVIAELPDSAWSQSITPLDQRITDLDRRITDLDTRITEVDERTTEGDEAVVSLASDILFAFDKADLSARARAKIAEIADELPQGATVQVHGHTDSHGTDERNKELSLERAKTVAAVIEQARPDLDLQVEGFGPDRPVEPNKVDGEDNPEGRALNRRVEIRYDE